MVLSPQSPRCLILPCHLDPPLNRTLCRNGRVHPQLAAPPASPTKPLPPRSPLPGEEGHAFSSLIARSRFGLPKGDDTEEVRLSQREADGRAGPTETWQSKLGANQLSSVISQGGGELALPSPFVYSY